MKRSYDSYHGDQPINDGSWLDSNNDLYDDYDYSSYDWDDFADANDMQDMEDDFGKEVDY